MSCPNIYRCDYACLRRGVCDHVTYQRNEDLKKASRYSKVVDAINLFHWTDEENADWNQAYLQKIAHLGLTVGPLPDNIDAYSSMHGPINAPLPVPELPGAWPTPSFLIWSNPLAH